MKEVLLATGFWLSGALCTYLYLNQRYLRRLQYLRNRLQEHESRTAQELVQMRFKIKLTDSRHVKDVSSPTARGPRHNV